jgi:hypothetical protein
MSFLNAALKYRILKRKIFALRLMLFCVLLFNFQKIEGPSEEYKIKAVFLYNFAQFVEWPERAFLASGPELVIGVLGDDPFGPYLDETVRGEKVANHPLTVNRYQKVSDIRTCHVLFISKSISEKYEDVFQAVKGKSILTVSDASGFAKKGGMIRFQSEDNKIKLKINLDAARAEDLVISSKLLRIAEIVKTTN